MRVNSRLQETKATNDKSPGVSNIQVLIPAGQRSDITFVGTSRAQKGKGPVQSKPLTLSIVSAEVPISAKPVLCGLAIGEGDYRDPIMALK